MTIKNNYMKTRTLSKIIRLSCAVGVLTAAAVQATPITYDYTGNPFTSVSGPYTTSDKVTGFVTFATPLGANMPLTSETPTAFSFSDGVQTITSANASTSTFSFVTGPTGGITQWNVFAGVISLGSASDSIRTSNLEGAEDVGMSQSRSGNGFNFGSPGVWSRSSAVPDAGSTMLLLSLSVTALGVAGARSKRAAA